MDAEHGFVGASIPERLRNPSSLHARVADALHTALLPAPQVYLILDEFICGGEIQETAKKVRGVPQVPGWHVPWADIRSALHRAAGMPKGGPQGRHGACQRRVLFRQQHTAVSNSTTPCCSIFAC